MLDSDPERELEETAREHFLDCLDLPPGEREEHLRQLPSDVAARARALLAAHHEASRLFQEPVASTTHEHTFRAGESIGRYQVIRTLGSGGFGSVYLAEQASPVVRRVAVKVLRAELTTTAARARFDAEHQALARMEHPGIARVFDGGTTQEGLPYIVLEYVEGSPITDECTRHTLGLKEILRLFRGVCRAVAHAHQRGVVHRDLKPSNILVTQVDGRRVAKVIDFGVAKALDGPLTDATVKSLAGEVMGTPAYMSPEQAAGDLDLDTRADVYALGAILYELLTGAPPFDSSRIGFAKLLQVIQQEDPELPSRKRTTSGKTTFQGRLPHDLDWIVMRCLEKRPGRRYPSVHALENDLERFLGGRPVDAAPPSVWYRARKLVHRHRYASAFVSAILLALAAGLLGTWRGLQDAREERDVAQTVLEFVRTDLIGAIRPDEARSGGGREIRLMDAVDRASERLAATAPAVSTVGEVRARASIDAMLAEIYSLLGDPGQGIQHARAASASFQQIGYAREPEALRCASGLVAMLREVGDVAEAVELGERTLASQRAILDPSDPATLATTSRLAFALRASGDNEGARRLGEELVEQAQEAGDEATLDVAHTLLGVIASGEERFVDAEEHFREALRLARRSDDSDSVRVLERVGNLASCLYVQRKAEEALALFETSIDQLANAITPAHPNVLRLQSNRARALLRLGRTDEALELLQEQIELADDRLGRDSVEAAGLRALVATILVGQGQTEQALSDAEEAFRVTQAALGEDAPETQARRGEFLQIAFRAGPVDSAAVEIARQQVASRERTHGVEHEATHRARLNLALFLADTGDHLEAAQQRRSVLTARAKAAGEGSPLAIETAGLVVESLREAGELDEALRLGREVEGYARTLEGASGELLGMTLAQLGLVLAEREETTAREVLEEARTLLANSLGEEAPWTLHVGKAIAQLP